MKHKRFLTAAVVTLAAAATLSACSTAKSYPSECTLVVGNGGFDNHKVKKVVYPGTTVKIAGDEDAWYIPCNSRNWRVTDNPNDGDVRQPFVSYTKASPSQPRMQVKIQLSVYFGLNENQQVLKTAFTPFCEKYTCYSTKANDNNGSSNFATAGFIGMLKENMQPALNRAVQSASQDFGPELWSDRAQWTKLGDEVSQQFSGEARKGWATSAPNTDFFCGDTTASINGKCSPVSVVIDSVAPVDSRVQQIANDELVLQQQVQLTTDQIAQAKLKYGSLANYYLGLMDSIQKCKDSGTNCTVVVGSPGTLPSVGGK